MGGALTVPCHGRGPRLLVPGAGLDRRDMPWWWVGKTWGADRILLSTMRVEWLGPRAGQV